MSNLIKERPILFSGAMVRALLDGSKTQTRRIMKPQPEPTPPDYPGPAGHWWPSSAVQSMVHVEQELQNQHGSWGGFCADCCPHGRVGDRLWVRETFLAWRNTVDNSFSHVAAFKADRYELEQGERWQPSIHMPRAASRILLEIVSVRVERLQDISEADADAEGVLEWARGACAAGNPLGLTDVGYFSKLREQTYGPGSWDANPWVWVIEFKRVAP